MDDFIFTSLGQKGLITSCNHWSITLKRLIQHFRTTFLALKSTKHQKSLTSLNKSMIKTTISYDDFLAQSPLLTLGCLQKLYIHTSTRNAFIRQEGCLVQLTYYLPNIFLHNQLTQVFCYQVLSSCCILYIVVSNQHIHASYSIYS